MRRTLSVLSLAAVALLLSACAGASGPGWTFAPPTPQPVTTPAPSSDASAAPSAEASATPADPNVVQVSASGVNWETPEITAKADTEFTIHFDNKDAGIPHNVVVQDGMGMVLAQGNTINGPATEDLKVPALAAGEYKFVCTIHPNMVGKLTVGN